MVVCGAHPAELWRLHQAWRHSNLAFGAVLFLG